MTAERHQIFFFNSRQWRFVKNCQKVLKNTRMWRDAKNIFFKKTIVESFRKIFLTVESSLKIFLKKERLWRVSKKYF